MKKYLADLHIHTVLSPCSDILMTPVNILNKAVQNNIDIISITDHNSAANVKSTLKIAQRYDIIIVPGIEVQSSEDIHLLSYFDSYSNLKSYADIIYNALPDIKNEEEKLGQQILVDKDDKLVAKEDKLLANSTKYTIKELIDLTYQNSGIPVPAHIDRNFGLIKILGFIPDILDISFVEVNRNIDLQKYYLKFPYLEKYNFIKNSDSHFLHQINPTMQILIEKEPSVDGIFSYIKENKMEDYLIKP